MTPAQRRYLQPHTTSDHECIALAAKQLGVITRQQLLSFGVGERAIDYRVATGLLIRCYPGVYRFPAVPSSWQQELLAVCLWTNGVASHRAAASLWRMAGIGRCLEITTTKALHGCAGIVVHRGGRLSNVDRGKLGPVPVTSPARTIIDLAAVLPIEDLELAIDDALHRKVTTVSRIEQRLAALGTQGRRGTARLVELLAQLGENPRAPTKFERVLSKVLATRPLPPFIKEHEVIDRNRIVARIDFAWPAQKVGVEADSFKWHSSTQAFRRDRERSNDLTLLGWKLHRVTWWEAVERPVEVRSSVASLLGVASFSI